jgi:hypothetical protein
MFKNLLNALNGKSDNKYCLKTGKKEMYYFYILCDGKGRIWSCTEANSRIRIRIAVCDHNADSKHWTFLILLLN